MVTNKIYDIDALAEKIVSFNSKGGKIILCHGVFDLLHIGHIKYFKEAKSMGGILIVTITPDRFVNKGPGRPAFNQKYRAEAIAALEVVDFVAINEWPTAIEPIKILKPDLYVKGPDYKDYKEDVTGNIQLEEDAVKLGGGRIAFTSDVTFSSSLLINQQISQLDNEQKQFLEKLKSKYSFNQINEYIDQLKELKVLLIGELIIDEYVFCNTIGKSGKEPVLVSQKISSDRYAGGVLAVANQISDFCKEGKVLSYLGDSDESNQFIKQNLGPNISLDCIIKSDSPTILKTRYIDNYTKTKTLGVYDINDKLINEEEESEFSSKFQQHVEEFDVVIVVDYGHGLISPEIVRLVQEKSRYLAVNTQLNSFNIGFHSISKYSNADYICVHEGELRHDYRNRSDTVNSLIKNLSERVRSDNILITQGKKGSLAFNNDEFISCPAYALNVVDRIGAGDTLLAITSLCFSIGIPTDLTLFIGNLAAAEMVASVGTGMRLSKTNLLKGIRSLLK